MKAEKDFYLSDLREISRALYRNGNASTVRFTNQEGSIRPQDAKLQTDSSSGIVYVLPSHAGVSASEVFDGGANRWKIRAGTQVPCGLALAVDRIVPGHVHIVATRRMNMSTGENDTSLTLEWFDAVVVLTSPIECIDSISAQLDVDGLGENLAYDLEERLNDYQLLARKLKIKYAEIADKGELPESMRKRLADL